MGVSTSLDTNGQVKRSVARCSTRRPCCGVFAAHTKWGPTSLPTPTIRFCPARSAPLHPVLLLLRSAVRKTMRRGASGTIRRRFGRPPCGGRPHLESPSSSLLASAEAVAVQAMDCISRTRSGSHQLVGIAAFRDQATGRFPRRSVRSLLASLATTLDVPVARRLCRPMI